MKKLLALVLGAFVSLAAFAAAPVVTIANTGNCYVDGVNVGAPADAIANNPALASPIQTALAAFVTKVNTDQAAATKAAQDSTAAQVAAAQAASAAAIEANASALAAAKARISQLEAALAAAQLPVPPAP